MNRIATLLPSATEIVCMLGLQARLVGRSHECDYPPAVTALPVLTSPKFDPHGSSAELDQRVKRILAEALSVYRVDAEMLRRLAPDVIVTQSQCDVCAVSMREVEDAVAQWVGGARPKIISLAPFSLADVRQDIARVARELDELERGTALVASLNQRLDCIQQRAASSHRPTIVCIEWIEPLMAAGNWMPELIEMAGGSNVFGKAGGHAPRITFQDLAAADPDFILFTPCGFSMEQTAADLPHLSRQLGWPGLKAVREDRVYAADGNHYFNRPGPRIVESLEILSEIVHPELFHFGHEGDGWRHL